MSEEREDKRKHLEMIQAVINRLASNSFSVKTWAVTLVAALVALGAQGSKWGYTLLALIPGFAFWGLDAYFLREERRFRKLYDTVRVQEKTDYSMDVSRFSAGESLDEVAARGSVSGFYVGLLVAVGVVAGITCNAG